MKGGQAVGSWTATTTGGTFAVKLQIDDQSGQRVVFNDASSLSWTLTVYPDAAASAPAVDTLGIAMMVAMLIAAGGWVFSRQQGFRKMGVRS